MTVGSTAAGIGDCHEEAEVVTKIIEAGAENVTEALEEERAEKEEEERNKRLEEDSDDEIDETIDTSEI